MTIEEKAKAYDEAIEKAKVFKEHLLEINDKDYADEMDYIFPELAESEDEKTRKALLQFLNAHIGCSIALSFCTQHIIKWIEWIENQGKQKPEVNCLLSWSEEDNIILSRIIADYERSNEEWFNAQNSLPHGRKINWLKSLKDRIYPKQEWSEEDERMFKSLNKLLNEASCYSCTEGVDKILSWFKSLKQRIQPQNTWKPSEEQMNTLEYYMHILVCNEYKEILFGLYADLKKLREE